MNRLAGKSNKLKKGRENEKEILIIIFVCVDFIYLIVRGV